jgi:hypothetical protein
MEYIKGYVFTTKEEADLKMAELNAFFKLPAIEVGGTSYFYEQSYIPINDFYFLYWADPLQLCLGEPVEISVDFGFSAS